MKTLVLWLAAALAAMAAPPVIFDTDMGNDIDDALALAMLHSLESRGECRLIGVTLTNPAKNAGPFVRMMNQFYKRGQIPVGISTAARKEGAQTKYLDAALAAAPHALKPAADTRYEEAVPLLRRLLKESSEKVILVQVGFSENLAELLKSDPELVKSKVALLSAMAGDFTTTRPEYNVKVNVPAAKKVFTEWPTPVILSGYEIGKVLLFPAASIDHDFNYVPWHPVVEAYHNYMKMPYDRQTWDLTAVLAAVRPNQYFELSLPGEVKIDDQGATTFVKQADGRSRYLILAESQRPKVLEALKLLASEPPH